MRLALAITAASLLFAGPVLAKGNPQMKTCAAEWKSAPHAGTTYKAFMSTCLHTAAPAAAPAPAAPPAPPVGPAAESAAKMPAPTVASPTGATAKCKDGTFSHSAHHSGSCSHHGGVAQFL